MDDSINWLLYAALAINASLVPLAANFVKAYMKKAPTQVKMILPLVAGSLIAMAEGKLLEVFGSPIDLDLIEQALLGAGVGMGASFGFNAGKVQTLAEVTTPTRR